MDGETMKWISVRAAAKLLSISVQRVYQLLESGGLVGCWSGETRLVGRQSVEGRRKALEDRKGMRLF